MPDKKVDYKLKVVHREDLLVDDLVKMNSMLKYSSAYPCSLDDLVRCRLFFMLYINDKEPPDISYDLAGFCTLGGKNTYKFAEFAKRAGYSLTPDQHFMEEMGNLCIVSHQRGLGYSKMLREAAFTHESRMNRDRFSIIREDNTALRATNARYGCIQRGQPFKSSRGDYNLVLYTREYTKAAPSLRTE